MPQMLSSGKHRSAGVSFERMKAAIPILKHRIAELRGIDVDKIHERGEARLDALEQKIDRTLEDIFGCDTMEYHLHRVLLDTASKSILYPTTIDQIREGYKKGIELAIENLDKIIKLLEEKVGDLAMADSIYGSALRAFHDLDIHPEVLTAVSDLLENGYYQKAIEAASNALDSLVKHRSGIHELEGAELMQHVFNEKDPVLQFNKRETESERNNQQGMMCLYSGVILALGNPGNNEFIGNDPEKALELIAFISLLAKALDKSQRNKQISP
jgi:uncharacterized protein (TIGR02391 family)